MSKKVKKLTIGNKLIPVEQRQGQDYISLTAMLKGEDDAFFIADWLRNKNTLEFLAVWETLNNEAHFNRDAFEELTRGAGLNSFKISVKQWREQTRAIGLFAKSGRYGGTYAHKDIAFEFGAWINPTFKLYLIKEYQRLKEIESNTYNLEWNVRRIVSKANYQLHTEAIKSHIIPKLSQNNYQERLAYAEEADLLNLAVFGCTAKDWREANPKLAAQNQNMRDMASINQLAVLSNLEMLNADYLEQGLAKEQRFERLRNSAQNQLTILDAKDALKALPKTSESIYLGKKKS